MMYLVIDDERIFNFGAFVMTQYAKNSTAGILIIIQLWMDYMSRMGEKIEVLWLDHDLGEGDTIRPVVELLYIMGKTTEGFTEFIPEIRVHSQNPTTGWIISNLGMAGFKKVEKSSLPSLI